MRFSHFILLFFNLLSFSDYVFIIIYFINILINDFTSFIYYLLLNLHNFCFFDMSFHTKTQKQTKKIMNFDCIFVKLVAQHFLFIQQMSNFN